MRTVELFPEGDLEAALARFEEVEAIAPLLCDTIPSESQFAIEARSSPFDERHASSEAAP